MKTLAIRILIHFKLMVMVRIQKKILKWNKDQKYPVHALERGKKIRIKSG